jgi:ADP-ribose pyrophosphatase YjhB (NUDIX family)
MLPVKHSVAVVIFRDDQILAIRRREDDDELPGIWGLPAGTLRNSETVTDLIERIGLEKLQVKLTPVRCIAAGAQDRPSYRLEMELWEASMDGTPTHPEWQWASLDILQPGKTAGSLCCELAIATKAASAVRQRRNG